MKSIHRIWIPIIAAAGLLLALWGEVGRQAGAPHTAQAMDQVRYVAPGGNCGSNCAVLCLGAGRGEPGGSRG